jgi:thiol-disulfide isomerase/thioredoxin
MRRIVLMAAALVAPALVHAQGLGLDTGIVAPAAALETLDGKPVNLSTYIGKGPVLLEFWATWCPQCEALEPLMKSVYTKYSARVKFVVVAVSVNQNAERVKATVQRRALPGEFLYDKDGDATDKYDVPGTSYIVILDKTGKVVYTGAGTKQDLDAAIQKALAR